MGAPSGPAYRQTSSETGARGGDRTRMVLPPGGLSSGRKCAIRSLPSTCMCSDHGLRPSGRDQLVLVTALIGEFCARFVHRSPSPTAAIAGAKHGRRPERHAYVATRRRWVPPFGRVFRFRHFEDEAFEAEARVRTPRDRASARPCLLVSGSTLRPRSRPLVGTLDRSQVLSAARTRRLARSSSGRRSFMKTCPGAPRRSARR